MSFRGFLDGLRDDGLLQEIRDPVSPLYQAADMAIENRPLLFHNLAGCRGAINLLGTRSLLGRALGIPATDMASSLSGLSFQGEVRMVNSSPFQEVSVPPDVGRLPIFTHFQGDGGPYITSAVVVSRRGKRINACVHRLMVAGPDRLAARLVPGRHTHQMYHAAMEEGEPLPVAIAIGVDPVVLIAASTRVPDNLEFQYAAALRGRPVELVELDCGVPVPHAEIVLVGHITSQRMAEGPFVDITGTLDLVRQEPVIQLTGMMYREDPIYQALLPAGGEHKMLMGVPYEPLIYRAVSRVARVKNVLLTDGGCCYFHAVVQIDKQSEEDGPKTIEAAFQAHGSLKHILVVDQDIDIFDPADLEFAIATRMRGDQDLYIYPRVRGSTLDPRSEDGITTKVGVDATARLDRLWKFQRVARKAR